MLPSQRCLRSARPPGLLALLAALLTCALPAGARPDAAAFGHFRYPPDSPGEMRGPGMFDLSEEVVTPHTTAWAKPLPGKRLRALFVVPRWYSRQVVELAHRLDMDYRVAMTGTPYQLSENSDSARFLEFPAERPRDVVDRLERRLYGNYDAIAIGRFPAAELPHAIWTRILDQVRAGTGLILTRAEDERVEALRAELEPAALPAWILEAVPPDPVAEMLGADGQVRATAGRLGRGRVLITDYSLGGWQALSPRAGVLGLLEDACAYDYQQSLVARMLMWAGRRDPTVSAGLALKLPAQVDFGAGLDVRARFRDGHGARARLRVRNVADKEYFRADRTLSGRRWLPGQQPEARWRLPARSMPVGSYYADVWMLDAAGQVLDWASRSFEVAHDQFVRSVDAPSGPIRPDGVLEVKLELARPLAGNERLRVGLVDYHGRVTGRTEVAGPQTAALGISLETGRPLSLAAQVQVELFRDSTPLHRLARPVPVQRPYAGPGWEDFSFLVWGFDDGIFFDYLARQLVRDYGLDRILWYCPQVRPEAEVRVFATRYNCRPFPFTAGGIWHMSHFISPEQQREQLHAQIASMRPWGLAEINLGDECRVPDEPIHLEDGRSRSFFQDAMREAYGGLELLNSVWGTSLEAWEEVRGISLAEARAQGRPAQYMDYRRFMDSYFAGHFTRASRIAAEVFPEARVGYENALMMNSLSAVDFFELMGGVRLMSNAWTPPETEAVRSFALEDAYLGAWNGSYTGWFSPEYHNWRPWYSLFHGQNGCWYWVPYFAHGDAAFGMYYPDLRINPTVRPFLESMRELKEGPARLLLAAERQDYGLAIHYSQRCLHADALDNAGWINNSVEPWNGGRLNQAWIAFMWGLQDGGLQYELLAPEEIEGGALEKYRVLFLPFAQALSRAEADAIRDFVEAGGTVVADLRPGVRDELGRRLERGGLDELFGVRYRALDRLSERGDKEIELAVSGQRLAGILPMAEVDPAVELAGGDPLAFVDGVPVVIENRWGAGRAVLLNTSVGYSDVEYTTVAVTTKYQVDPVRGSGRDDTWVELLRALVARAGVRPELELRNQDHHLRGAETVTYRDGPARYYGVFGCPHNDMALLWNTLSKTASGRLREPGHLYDVRAGEYLGHGDTFERPYHHAEPLLLAVLPYRVTGIAVAGPAAAAPGETVSLGLEVKTETDPAGRHVLRVEVFGPDGIERAALAANVEAPAGGATFKVPLALNSDPGAWRLRVRDVATSVVGEAILEVRHLGAAE